MRGIFPRALNSAPRSLAGIPAGVHTLSYQCTAKHPVYITKCLYANERLLRGAGSWQCHVGLARARLCALFHRSRDFSALYWEEREREGGNGASKEAGIWEHHSKDSLQTRTFIAFLFHIITQSRYMVNLVPLDVERTKACRGSGFALCSQKKKGKQFIWIFN